jgi:hypothetical protein
MRPFADILRGAVNVLLMIRRPTALTAVAPTGSVPEAALAYQLLRVPNSAVTTDSVQAVARVFQRRPVPVPFVATGSVPAVVLAFQLLRVPVPAATTDLAQAAAPEYRRRPMQNYRWRDGLTLR